MYFFLTQSAFYFKRQGVVWFCQFFCCFLFFLICSWILNQGERNIKGIFFKKIFCIHHHLNRSSEPIHLNKKRIKKITRLNYAFNFKSHCCVYLQRAFRDKWLLLKWWSHQHMAAFISSHTVKKIELSLFLEPIFFPHASQTGRNEGSSSKCELSWQGQVKIFPFTFADEQKI